MNFFIQLSNWLTGASGDSPGYMKLANCMRGDTLWIAITVGLDLTVAAGYGLIAMHWWKNSRLLPPTPAKRALGNMRNIFLFCGMCGYVFIPIKMFWPAWRLYDAFMVFLAYFTWRYAWGARELKVVYGELGRTSRLAADLEQSRQESAEKTFFLNAISHDLRTPLNGLILNASVAEMAASSDDPVALKNALTDMKGSARHAAELLDSLLDYAQLSNAKSSSEERHFCDLAGAVADVVERFRSRADAKGLVLSHKVPPGVMVHADRAVVGRILINLLDNALKFTDRGFVKVEAETDGSGLEIHVLDSGIGIAPQHQNRLFEEFFQIDNGGRDRTKGYGLGLAIARKLARQLGGDIAVESAAGHGSRFTLAIPRVVASLSGPIAANKLAGIPAAG